MTKIKVTGYGRSHLLPPTSERLRMEAQTTCAKCRRLEVTSAGCKCANGHAALDPSACGDFSDCSREKNYMPNRWPTHPDLRR